MIYFLYPLLTSDIVKKMSDEDIVKEYLVSQNAVLFDALYKRYSGKIFGKCISILKNESSAEDAMQDIFMKILGNLSKFSGRSKFSTWIYSITYNYCIDLVRRKKKDKSVLVEDMAMAHDVSEDVNDSFLMEINISRLAVVLEKIPTMDKTILLMKYQDSLSIKEISEVLTKSESAIKMKIKRAKQKFRKIHKEIYKDS